MTFWKAVCVIVLTASFGATAAFAAETKTCTREQAIAAEGEASTLKTWTEVYRSFRHYAQCDDASIGEGYSEAVARLLSDHWDATASLAALAKTNKSFESFVLKHVDELMSPEQETSIRNNHSVMPLDWSRCPAVESVPGRLSGAWVFKDSRIPVAAVFANLEAGLTIDEVIELFDGLSQKQVKAVLEFTAHSLEAPVPLR